MIDETIEFATRRDLLNFVRSFEDGSLPATAWNERTVAVVGVFYLSILPVAEAAPRLEAGVRRNRDRFPQRGAISRDGTVHPNQLWPRVLQLVLLAASPGDPLPLANRLLREHATVLAARVA